MASKMKVQLVGKSRGHEAGEVVEVPKERAEVLIREGHAISVTEAGKRLEREIRDS